VEGRSNPFGLWGEVTVTEQQQHCETNQNETVGNWESIFTSVNLRVDWPIHGNFISTEGVDWSM